MFPFGNQIFVADGGQLGCDFVDGIREEGDGFGVLAEEGVVASADDFRLDGF